MCYTRNSMTRPLYEMFNSVPRHYDLLNKLMTLGLDKKWRNKAALECLKSSPENILDICCGTGDLAHSLALMKHNNTKIFALDYSQPMLDVAIQKNEASAGCNPERILRRLFSLHIFAGRCEKVSLSMMI